MKQSLSLWNVLDEMLPGQVGDIVRLLMRGEKRRGMRGWLRLGGSIKENQNGVICST